MPLISRFDPWRSSLCTCPPKLTFNPYSGCDHECVYCYASSYIPNFSHCHPKKDLQQNLRREAAKLRGEILSMSNSSDPYPRQEATAGWTRKCLKILKDSDCRVQIVTKSNLVMRDEDLLSEMHATVALTITTDDDEIAKFLEPQAPPPSVRLRAAEDLTRRGIPVAVRIDPVIPFVNDCPEKLVATLASIGVRHITSSTYKVRLDNWRRFAAAMPNTAEKLKPLYFEHGEKLGGNTMLPRDLRLKLMKNIRDLTVAQGMKFGSCREAMPRLNTAACDGSWLLNAHSR